MSLKISISGVRGSVPGTLTPEVCLDFAKAFGTYLAGTSKKVVIGTDPRATSEYIKGIIFSGLLSAGCDVIDIGICPTPTVGIMVRELKAAGGIVITASHNPLPWNGLKFMRHDGIFLNESQAKRLIKLFENKSFTNIKGRSGSVRINESAIDIHIKKIFKAIKPARTRRKKFKVVLDAGNGAGSVSAIQLLKALGCKVVPLYCDATVPFQRSPEPVAIHIGKLMQIVKNHKADIGFALDSDADRLAVVSEKGLPIGEETTLALAIKAVLSRSAGKNIVAVNLSTTQSIDDIVGQAGGRVIRTKVGEVHVAETLRKNHALIGGEGNGGIIYPQVGYNRDSMTGIAIILDYLARSKKTVSELVKEIPAYYSLKKKIECKNQAQANKIMAKVKTRFKKKDLILTEGIKAVLPSGWIHIRPSNTEPIIRIIAEGQGRQAVNNLVKQAL